MYDIRNLGASLGKCQSFCQVQEIQFDFLILEQSKYHLQISSLITLSPDQQLALTGVLRKRRRRTPHDVLCLLRKHIMLVNMLLFQSFH